MVEAWRSQNVPRLQISVLLEGEPFRTHIHGNVVLAPWFRFTVKINTASVCALHWSHVIWLPIYHGCCENEKLNNLEWSGGHARRNQYTFYIRIQPTITILCTGDAEFLTTVENTFRLWTVPKTGKREHLICFGFPVNFCFYGDGLCFPRRSHPPTSMRIMWNLMKSNVFCCLII